MANGGTIKKLVISEIDAEGNEISAYENMKVEIKSDVMILLNGEQHCTKVKKEKDVKIEVLRDGDTSKSNFTLLIKNETKNAKSMIQENPLIVTAGTFI